MAESVLKLQEAIGYQFFNKKLLEQALTHASYAGEMNAASNERLEFLGDSLIEAAVRHGLFLKYPLASEGDLTLAKSKIVCKGALARIARKIGLGEHLLLGRGESTKGRNKEAILADALEALIGAVYLDSSYETTKNMVNIFFLDELGSEEGRNYKGDLQEICQRQFHSLPRYRVVRESGAAHLKIFDIEVVVNTDVLGKGTGQNKKEAEQSAAREALSRILSEKPKEKE